MSTKQSAGKLHKPWTFKSVIRSLTKDPELERVQTHHRPLETRVDDHNYVIWRNRELQDVSMKQLQMSLADFAWAPGQKQANRTVYEIYQQMLRDAVKRINSEMRIKHAPYILQDGAQILQYHHHSENARYLDYALPSIYGLNGRPPRRKFLVNVVSLMFPDPGMNYTS